MVRMHANWFKFSNFQNHKKSIVKIRKHSFLALYSKIYISRNCWSEFCFDCTRVFATQPSSSVVFSEVLPVFLGHLPPMQSILRGGTFRHFLSIFLVYVFHGFVAHPDGRINLLLLSDLEAADDRERYDEEASRYGRRSHEGEQVLGGRVPYDDPFRVPFAVVAPERLSFDPVRFVEDWAVYLVAQTRFFNFFSLILPTDEYIWREHITRTPFQLLSLSSKILSNKRRGSFIATWFERKNPMD